MSQEDTLSVGDLTIDFLRSRVWRGSREVHLSRREYAILYYLARNAGFVVPGADILDVIWGDDDRDNSHLLYSNINRLRRKIGPESIVAYRGLGYCFAPRVVQRANS